MQDVVYKPLQSSESTDISPVQPKIDFTRLCLLYGRRITQSASSSGTATGVDMYSVPQGKIFLLMHASLCLVGVANGGWGRIHILPTTSEVGASFTFLQLYNWSDNTTAVACNPTVPVLVLYGEKINIYNVNNQCTTNGTIQGYEIDADLFYKSL